MLIKNKIFLTGIACLLALTVLSVQTGVLSASHAQQTQPQPQQKAERILNSTGIKGGLVIHVGCGDGRLTAALHANDNYLVHGLDRQAKNVELAREYIQSHKLYGTVSVDHWKSDRLPYIDNLVNLLVSENIGGVSMDEVMRVLAPDGMAYLKKKGEWTKIIKPRPSEIDEWTHYLYDASGNSVAHDSVVGPPRYSQWVGSPKWARHHDHMASMSALVSAGGRLFYIFDEGPTSSILLPPEWSLIARDAFNGTVLWKRSIPEWVTHLWPLKSGPAHLPRRLVAVKDKVYVTLGLEAPLSVLDTATGRTIRTYEGTRATEEVIVSGGTVFLLANNNPVDWNKYKPSNAWVWGNMVRTDDDRWAWDKTKRRIMAIRAETGELLWNQDHCVAPMTLAADQKGVFFYDGKRVVCLNRQNGNEIWISSPVAGQSRILPCFGARLIIYQDVVLFSGGRKSMTALSAKDGKILWKSEQARSGHRSPEDLLVAGGLVWSGAAANTEDSGVFTGRDPLTGEIKSEFPPDVDVYWFHQRCYPSKATDKYLLPSRTGIEFIDFRNKHWMIHHWVRGGCIYGIMPCNGLIYTPPHACACYIEAKQHGFCALAPASTSRAPDSMEALKKEKNRLEHGRAYGKPAEVGVGVGVETAAGCLSRDEWPTYRHNAARSGCTDATVSTNLKPLWQSDLGGKLSSVVIAEKKVFVASVDTHTLYALDADSGETLWNYTTGGRIDSPPTIYKGRVLFGSADGWVYCLRSSDGELVWRFRAAPMEQRMTAYEQLESVWPVHGSVLVQKQKATSSPKTDTERAVVYCVAGRSMFLDGGLRLLRLDAETGRQLSETILDENDPQTGGNLQSHVEELSMPVALPDILSSDGQFIFMRSQRFDLDGRRPQVAKESVMEQQGDGAHLFCGIGFLDDSWFHRSYWLYGRSLASGWPNWFQAGRYVPSGRLLVFDDSFVYGYQRQPKYLSQSSVQEYRLFAADKNSDNESIRHVRKMSLKMDAAEPKKWGASAADWKLRGSFPLADISAVKFKWTHGNLPLHVRAMVLADKTLFIAGPPDVADEEKAFFHSDDAGVQADMLNQTAALAGRKGALLWAVSASDGKKIREYKLGALPVWDGMATAYGRLYLSLKNGRVQCFGSAQNIASSK